MSKNKHESPSLALATGLVGPGVESMHERNLRWAAVDARKQEDAKAARRNRVRVGKVATAVAAGVITMVPATRDTVVHTAERFAGVQSDAQVEQHDHNQDQLRADQVKAHNQEIGLGSPSETVVHVQQPELTQSTGE